MFEKLESLEDKYVQLTRDISNPDIIADQQNCCLLYTSPSPRDSIPSRMPSSA